MRAVVAAGLLAALQPPPTTFAPSTIALVETYTDGHTTYELVSPKPAWSWTSKYVPVEGFLSKPGARKVFAVKFARVLLGQQVHVRVSVLISDASDEAAVTEVTLSAGQRVRVDDLLAYGVQPVELSLAEAAPMMPYLPLVFTVTPEVEVADVVLLDAPYPGYRVTLRNLGPKPASNFHVQSFYGEDKALSALKRDDSGRPVLTAGGSYTFDINLTSGGGRDANGRWSPRPLDVIQIDAVRWADGSYSGRPSYPGNDPIIERDSGGAEQFRRIIAAYHAVLDGAGSPIDKLTRLRASLESLADADPDQLDAARTAMLNVKRAAVADIFRFQGSPSAHEGNDAIQSWLEHSLARYQSILGRIQPR